MQLRWLKSDLSRIVCCLQSNAGGKQRLKLEDIALPATLLEISPKGKGSHFLCTLSQSYHMRFTKESLDIEM